ncbi:hypothetical protein KCU77_g133, partial [Aureobasidium melanogenum]
MPSRTNATDDHIELIAVMGATGAGKSSFINHIIAPDAEPAEVGHKSKSCTSEVNSLPFSINGFDGSIIDTPGFDDTHLSDALVLEKIANWMEFTYRNKIKITGVLYLRDITEDRMKGSALKNFELLRKICGTQSLRNVVIVTTKWDRMEKQGLTEEAEEREQELIGDYFQPCIDAGAKTARHNNTARSARNALQLVLGNEGKPLKIQTQLVDEGMNLGETSAGEAVRETMDASAIEREKELRDVIEKLKTEQDKTYRRLLEKEQREKELEKEKAEADAKMLEADRQKQMAAYEEKLKKLAERTGESPTNVLLKGLSSGMTNLAPVLLQQWQQFKADAAREKAEQRAHEAEMEKSRQEAARQNEIEAKQRHLEAQNAQLNQHIQMMQSQPPPRRGVGLFEVLFGLY